MDETKSSQRKSGTKTGEKKEKFIWTSVKIMKFQQKMSLSRITETTEKIFTARLNTKLSKLYYPKV